MNIPRKIAELMFLAAVACSAIDARAASTRATDARASSTKMAMADDRRCYGSAHRTGRGAQQTRRTKAIQQPARAQQRAAGVIIRLPKRTRQWRSC